MKWWTKTTVVTTVLCLLPILLGLILYSRLPQEIPIHWNSQGEIDNTAAKPLVVFGMPILMAVLNLVLHVTTQHDPKKANFSRTLQQIGYWTCPVISLLTISLSLFTALGYAIDVSFWVPAGVGLLLIVVGNYLPKCRQSYTIGIKLPWTLHSEENWNKTHRIGGYVWMIGGLLFFLNAFIGSSILATGIILLIVLLPTGYSFFLYKKGI